MLILGLVVQFGKCHRCHLSQMMTWKNWRRNWLLTAMRSKKVEEHQEHPLAAGSEDEVEVVSVDTHDLFAVRLP